MTKVLVSGFRGSMGTQACKMIEADPELQLVGVYSPNLESTDAASYGLPAGCQVFAKLADIKTDADVWVDFSTPTGAFENAKFALENHMTPVIGTSGMTEAQVTELHQLADQLNAKGLIVPNFGLSAVLLMQFAKQAAKYFPDAEIIEMHHADKKDAPSGTAINTAKLIVEGRETKGTEYPTVETLPGARGADYDGVHIHAVRLPGYVAHEEVLFGGQGEALTIRQDSFDRASFMHGLNIAIKNMQKLHGFEIGLENVL